MILQIQRLQTAHQYFSDLLKFNIWLLDCAIMLQRAKVVLAVSLLRNKNKSDVHSSKTAPLFCSTIYFLLVFWLLLASFTLFFMFDVKTVNKEHANANKHC